MKSLSWFGKHPTSKRILCTRRALEDRESQSVALTVEALEDRLALSTTTLPGVEGAPTTPEGQLYTLQLNPGSKPIDHWTIDWGDGSGTTVVAGTATEATHLYADGNANYTITANATAIAPALQLVQFGGHYYGLTTQGPTTWMNAEAEAASYGGHLVSITDQSEQNFVVNTFLSGVHNYSIYWIGLNDAAKEGTFVWTSGDPVTYTNWQSGEPNNDKGVEDYVVINWHHGHKLANSPVGTWNDAPLNGIGIPTTNPEPYLGIMEFTTLPVGDTTTLTLNVTVTNLAPTASVTGTTEALRGEALTFTLSANDVPADSAAGFTFALDWNGDGVVDEVIQGPAGTQVSHVFGDTGSYNVLVTAMDKDGGVSEAATLQVNVAAVVLRTDPNDPTQTVLMIAGTDKNDVITVDSVCKQSAVRVLINGKDQGTFSADRIEVYGRGGNDLIRVSGFKGSALLDGGDGNDVLVAGPGDSRLVGGDGNDLLIGGRGNDVLLGGAGFDFLLGGGGKNVLDAGTQTVATTSTPRHGHHHFSLPHRWFALEAALVDRLFAGHCWGKLMHHHS